MKKHATAFAAALLVTSQLHAQVRCTMPNGVVIEQKLSPACPIGATKAQTLDGQPAPIAQPSPVVQAHQKPSTTKAKHPEANPIRRDGSMRLQNVSQEEFGDKWPLVVPKVELRCERDAMGRGLVTVRNGIAVFAVNGTARSAARAKKWVEDIHPIWLVNPAIPGTRIPITPLIERGLALCP